MLQHVLRAFEAHHPGGELRTQSKFITEASAQVLTRVARLRRQVAHRQSTRGVDQSLPTVAELRVDKLMRDVAALVDEVVSPGH
jgi:hypothetical protein